MPIDFARVPPRVPVPDVPRPSMLFWAVLLCAMLGLGAALTIFLWPVDRPTNTVRFGIYAVGFPVMAWGFLLSGYLGLSYLQVSQATATNRASKKIEDACHALAGMPLAMLGHAWCFSCNDQVNRAQGIVEGAVRMASQPSGVDPGVNINARWLQIPDRPFFPGNELTEHARHRVVGDWLLERLVERIGNGLVSLPARTALHVDLCVQSMADLAEMTTCLESLIRAKAPTLRIAVSASPESPSLFAIDRWHDRLPPREAQLVVLLRLHNAVSELLPNGAAEAGVAILLGQAGVVPRQRENPSTLLLHRPAISAPDRVKDTVQLAVRWGQAQASQIRAIWNHGLSEDLARSVKSGFGDGEQWVHVDKTIGNCAGVGDWMAVALAAEHALITGEPQLILSQQGSDFIALLCRT